MEEEEEEEDDFERDEEVKTTKYEPDENLFRITNRKRFWKGSKDKDGRKRESGYRLEIRGLGSKTIVL